MQVKVNTKRLWERLMMMAEVGATPKGGVCRLALTEEDRKGRDLFVRWCENAGCSVTVDALGNIFARREGLEPDLPAVLLGSHLDSQPTGGKYDGALGVLVGLEIIETLNDLDISTRAAVEVVSWSNEEGARFAPAMLASGAWAGVFTKDFAQSRKDKDGITFLEALESIGYKGSRNLGEGKYAASLELHIEQGPVLEVAGLSVGVVKGVQGIRWYTARIKGKEAHAGPTPMKYRKDPVQALLPFLGEVYEIGKQYAPDSKVTVGEIHTLPGVRNTVPGLVEVSIDLRHPEEATLLEMHQQLMVLTEQANLQGQVHFDLIQEWYSPPVHFDQGCIDALKTGAENQDLEFMDLVSGAGHDSVYLSGVMPTAMLFIPCRDGLSHNELESIEMEHAANGANVLLQATLQLADTSKKIYTR